MSAEALGPALMMLGMLLAIAAASPERSNIARTAFVAIAMTATLRYLWWRWTATLPEDWTAGGAGLYAFGCLIFETAVVLEGSIGTLVLARSRDRAPEADGNEAWAKSMPDAALPFVDVLIPTYNEEYDVLERTIVAATALDYPKFRVSVLDDGRRPWVGELAAAHGAQWVTRNDNAHAKAGNINAALPRLGGDLVLVLDADFAARRHLLWRTVGFFRDPRVACVQTPQYFFNKDPVQTNLGLFDRWADDQRLFFDVIMPARDAWGAAFCCGTGFLMRRDTLLAIGGIPTASLCEDMLTSIELKRRGLKTIYLKEELCIGLAPESVRAFFVQRQRWSRGNIQILFLRNGVFGRGLPLFYRLLFLPGYWSLQLPARLAYIFIPLIYLTTGLAPIQVTDQDALISHLLPAVLGGIGLIWWLARECYFPLLSDAATLFMAIRVAPAAVLSLFKPFGVPFSVTPKGKAAGGGRDRVVIGVCLALLLATLGAIAGNAIGDWSLVSDTGTLPLATFWALVNAVVLALAAAIGSDRRTHRGHDRFAVGDTGRLRVKGAPEAVACHIVDVSLGGAGIRLPLPRPTAAGEAVALELPGAGVLPARVVRRQGAAWGLAFCELDTQKKAGLIRYLYTLPRRVTLAARPNGRMLIAAMLWRLFGPDLERPR